MADLNLLDLVRTLRASSGLYILKPDYFRVVTFLTGVDHGSGGSVLLGFQEWLVVKGNGYGNLGWPIVALYLAFPDVEHVVDHVSTSRAVDRIAQNFLYDLLEEFAGHRSRMKIRWIFLEYERWLRRQSWYNREHPEYFELDDNDGRHDAEF